MKKNGSILEVIINQLDISGLVLVIFFIVFYFSSCCPDKKTTPDEKAETLTERLNGTWESEYDYLVIDVNKDTVKGHSKMIWCFINDTTFSFGNSVELSYTMVDSVIDIQGGYSYKVIRVNGDKLIVEELNNPFYTLADTTQFLYEFRKKSNRTDYKNISADKTVKLVSEKAIRDPQVSDTIRKIIDELNLCEYFIIRDWCYRKSASQFVNLTPDNNYDCFLFVTDGGSGGECMKVYCRKNGKYQEVNDIFAFYFKEKFPGTMTKGHYDIIASSRDYDRGMIDLLYKWNGSRYVLNKVLSVNNIPIDLLIAIGITDKNMVSFEYPYVGEKEGVTGLAYSMIKIDTLSNSDGKLELSVKSSGNYNYGVDKIWKVIFVNGRYTVVN